MDRTTLKRPAKSAVRRPKRLATEVGPLQRTASALTVLSPGSDSASDTKGECSQATTIMADELSVVKHDVVVSNIRAKNNTANGRRILSKVFFHSMAKQAESGFHQDLKNRCYTYRMPFVGSILCDFQCGEGGGTEKILSSDIITFKWTYHSGKVGEMVVAGSFESYHTARHLLNPNCIPRTVRPMLDAVCVAKIYYETVAKPSLLHFIKKYCEKSNLDVEGCEVIRIAHPKPLSTFPSVECLADSAGNLSKWFICASVDKNIVMCHPGPVSKHTTNRCTYRQSELRLFDLHEKKESFAKTFKRRKRSVVKENKCSFPTSLAEINDGRHRGFRDVFACGMALAEFESAKREVRQVSIEKALGGFLVDPFAWGNDRVASNNMFVLWRSPDGHHHIDGGTLRSLMVMIK